MILRADILCTLVKLTCVGSAELCARRWAVYFEVIPRAIAEVIQHPRNIKEVIDSAATLAKAMSLPPPGDATKIVRNNRNTWALAVR